MKSIVIFYSLDGHTKFVAELLAQELTADLVELELVKPFPMKGFKKYFWCGKSSVFREKPALKTKIPNLQEYDLIVIGTPVWAGNCASPINTLLSIMSNEQKLQGKKVGIVVTNGGGTIKRCVKQIKEALQNNEFLEPLHFVNPSKEDKDEIIKKIREWVQAVN
ncbi:flavodoxin [Fervidobacterium pennivorans subsp. shakshaketiis]|uniref:NADPH-dependent FMN reductase n=1 Tax=Fervidobacterium pennivorans (strain DSM 9078 / Ven5) TaxID=771875 RepID=H9UB58_FERPD|nr:MULTISPECIES: flavodoxin [Fervidobacterium]AFG34751.1 NADPH-dependent FMN reductase [Fervidobacterium pennivorans DSM 9078]NPU89006.1 flavodoxin [Fervidobacterium sp.]QIV78028.1 flavodoxin [Fervidobacterium pennivorans subsp. keratinolyticus]